MVTSRIWFTAAQKAELWERWKNGQSAAAISRAVERENKTCVEGTVVLHGGIGTGPSRRHLPALRFEEREELSKAGVPNPPRHADISRSDLSQPLHPDPGRAEEGADGAVAYCAADASPQEPQREEWTGPYSRYGLHPRAARRD